MEQDKRRIRRARIGNCVLCGEEYIAKNDITGKYGSKNRRIQKYCSKKCWLKRNPPELKTCLSCNKTFNTYERSKIYCTNKCRDEDYRIRFKGDKSHLWEGGKTNKIKLLRIHSKFREWRRKVFERDNYICQRCGLKSIKGKRIILHPHHINPLSKYPEMAYDVDNGMTLCYECHQELHFEIKLSYTGKKSVKIDDGNSDKLQAASKTA